jgi:Mrp family chromosome partitioning ATPase/capsular polysaccharide biosynthesis protein
MRLHSNDAERGLRSSDSKSGKSQPARPAGRPVTPAATPRDRPEGATASELLASALAVLARRWRLAALIVVFTALTGFALSAREPKRYAATAQIVVASGGQLQGLALGTNSVEQTDLERTANTDLALVKLQSIAARVRDELGLRMTARELLSKVTTSYEGNSNILGINVLDSSPTRAAAIANGFAKGYQTFRRDTTRATLQAALDSARSRLIALGPDKADTPFAKLLNDSINRLQIASVVDPGEVKIAQSAVPPRVEANTRPIVTGFIGLIVGCVLAAALLALLERLDDRLHDEQSAERVFGALGLQVLSTLWLGRGPRGEAQEQRTLARLGARLMRSAAEGDQVIMVAAPADPTVSATLTIGLAKALGNLGQRVIVIDANLTQPGIGGAALNESPGLSALLAGETVLEAELHELRHDGAGQIEVLPAGSAQAPPELALSGDAMRRVLHQARQWADVVIVAGPPLLSGAEPVTLVPLADAILVVAEIGDTTAREARESVALLQELDATVLGAVAARTERRAHARALAFDGAVGDSRESLTALRAGASGAR